MWWWVFEIVVVHETVSIWMKTQSGVAKASQSRSAMLAGSSERPTVRECSSLIRSAWEDPSQFRVSCDATWSILSLVGFFHALLGSSASRLSEIAMVANQDVLSSWFAISGLNAPSSISWRWCFHLLLFFIKKGTSNLMFFAVSFVPDRVTMLPLEFCFPC